MENISVPSEAKDLGTTLKDLKLFERFGIQVCGIERGQERILVPSSNVQILGGDRLLLLGTHDRIRDYYTHLTAQ